MKFANLHQIAAFLAIGLINCATGAVAHAQFFDDSVTRVFFSRGEQQWRYSQQRAETAPVIVFLGTSPAVVHGELLPPWFAVWNASTDTFRSAPLRQQQAELKVAVVRVFDAYVQSLRDGLGNSRIERIALSRDTTNLSGHLTGRVTSLRGADTVVNGVLLHTINDIANVVLVDTVRWPKESLENGRVDVQRLRGTVVTRRLFDIVTGATIQSRDSVAVKGRETRRFADGRVISGSVRLQLVRHGEMVSVREFGRRSAHLADSISQHEAYYRSAYLQLGDSLKRESRPRLLAPHDKAAALATLLFSETLGFTKWHYELLRPVLDDRARAMKMGFDADAALYILGNMVVAPLRVGPSVPRPVICSEGACQLIMREWSRANDPRLRNIGLMFRYVEAPACYLNAVLDQSTKYPIQFGEIRRYALGISQESSNTPPVSIPALSDDWRAWFDWLRGGPAEYFAKIKLTTARTAADSAALSANPFGFRNSYFTRPALNHIAYRTGFAYRDTFNLRLSRESNDTARAVYSTLSGFLVPRAAYDTTSAQWRANHACQQQK